MFGGMPSPHLSPVEGGSEAGGFRIYGSHQGTLRFSAWGYWTPDVARAFGKEAVTVGQRLLAAGVFVLDATELKPQGADGQEALRALFRSLGALTFARGLVFSMNVMTRMQLSRLARECGVDGKLEFGDSSTILPGATGP